MAQLNVVTQEKAEKNKQKDLGLDVQDVGNGCVNSTAPFFCDYVINTLLQDTALGDTLAERKNVLKNGGLVIKTTLDPAAQADADNAVAAHVQPTDGAIGAMAIEQPGTGNVVALAQSRPMGNRKKVGETYINFTVPEEYGGANGFQPGSTFKVFTLATALEQGYPLTTQFDSPSPKDFDLADFSNCPGEGFFGGDYEAHNDTGTGWFNMYSGTRQSINTFYLQLEELTGVCAPFQLATELGVRLTNPTGDKFGNGAERVPTFTLGIADASPLEMAEAYATFAARGLHCASRPVTEITDANGNVLHDYDPQCTQVVPQNVADAVSDVLRGVIAPGGFAEAQQLSVAAAGKTGTTTEQKAVWFCGYTSHYAAAATVAGIDESGRPSSLVGKVVDGSTIYEASGSQYAAPIWGDALRPLTDGQPYDDFVYPEGIEGVGATTATPPKPARPPKGQHGGGHGGHHH
jgi:membrane peptidoglycan carboxypeptidase